jgi:hypothetical protein
MNNVENDFPSGLGVNSHINSSQFRKYVEISILANEKHLEFDLLSELKSEFEGNPAFLQVGTKTTTLLPYRSVQRLQPCFLTGR